MMKLGNGLWEHTNFNSRLQSTQIGLGTTSSGAGSTSVLGLDYTYGVIVGGALDTTKNNGNIESQTINAPGLSLKQNYTYDQVNRLLSASEALSGAQQWKQQFTYDRFGNRNFDLASTTGNVLGPNPTIDPSTNRFASGQSYEYDLSGNITKDPTTNPNVILYDAENRQVSYTKAGATTAYVYDGGGYRVQRITGGEATVFVYDVAGKLIAEYDTDPPPNPVGGGGTSYLTTDHLGSTRVVTTGGPSPTLKARYDYLPFGEEIAPTLGNRTSVTGYLPSDSTRQKFTQYERDTESGLDFAGARYCSSGVGRFTSVDPSLASARSLSPQSWNRYVYVLNNPLVYIDPDGADWYRHNETGVFHWFPGSDPRDGYTWYKVGEAGLRLTNVRGYGRFAKYNGHNIVLLPNGQVIDQGLYVPPPPTDLPNLSGQVGIILAQMEPHHLIIVIAIVVTADVMYPLPNRNDAIPEFNDPLPSSNDALPGAPTPPVDWIVPGSLPAEEDAALLFALEHLDNGTRPPGVQSWGRPFRNDRGDLPGPAGGGGYSEYDVTPPPGTLNRGVRRIVASDTDGRVYYTWTHYGTAGDPPFVRVR
jgi:RHS repeat-associated protein